jgi:very-short-patch-repair endonuclease
MDSNPRTRTGGTKLWTKLKPKARGMRRAPTDAEAYLWDALRNRQVEGARFKRQQPIDRFIVDFYCAEARLVIEVDGPIHDDQREQDTVREGFLNSAGFRILRFTNEQVLESRRAVVDEIRKWLPGGNDET